MRCVLPEMCRHAHCPIRCLRECGHESARHVRTPRQVRWRIDGRMLCALRTRFRRLAEGSNSGAAWRRTGRRLWPRCRLFLLLCLAWRGGGQTRYVDSLLGFLRLRDTPVGSTAMLSRSLSPPPPLVLMSAFGGEAEAREVCWQRWHADVVDPSGSGRVHSAQRFFLRSTATLSADHCLSPAPMSRSDTGLLRGATMSFRR